METEFTKLRNEARMMSSDERILWVKAIAAEQSVRWDGTPLHYLWNRVWRAADDAWRKENELEGLGDREENSGRLESPVHGIVRSKGPCKRCGIRAWRWHRPLPQEDTRLVCVGCDHTRDGVHYPTQVRFTNGAGT